MTNTTYRADRSDAPAPKGSIKLRAEVLHLIDEAKEEGTVRIWTVTQSGYLSSFLITSRSYLVAPEAMEEDPAVLCSGPAYYSISNTMSEGSCGPFENKDGELLGTYNIESSAGACHFAFTSKMLAQRYSEELKNDVRYMASVKAWHKVCDTMFSGDDDYLD
jgi:hypothetical protein